MSNENSLLDSLKLPTSNDHKEVSFYLAIAMAIVVGSALAFEHIGGYIPCALCLEQRTPYYVGAPILVLAALSKIITVPAIITRLLILIAGLIMLYGMGLAAFHSGVEWLWWPGPESCGAAADGLSGNAGDLLADLNAKRPPSCDKAALRVFGLSFAGWNVFTSAVLAFFTLRLAVRKA
ncbi:disulfide bond formation protein B [Lentilitoribacter sp. EG35]|uniref:disulfide bond formation protein B n=1 Tax=Lentilitoribacter sp. EG35 TaxID=3234192 RepID=UPI003460B3C8